MNDCKIEWCNSKVLNKDFCNKHRRQLRNWGETRRTVYDTPEIIEYDRYLIIKVNDKNGYFVGDVILDKNNRCILDKYNIRIRIVKNRENYLIAFAAKNSEEYHLSRIILGYTGDKVVDHRNHNTLDNRKENLRICSKGDNNKNRILHKNKGKSKFKGVTIRYDKYISRISVDCKRINLGHFDTEIEAAKAYNDAAIKYHGNFAYQNIIEEEKG